MILKSIKDYISDNFTPMAWDRVELKLVSDINDLNDSSEVNSQLKEKISNTLVAMYGSGLSNEILNG